MEDHQDRPLVRRNPQAGQGRRSDRDHRDRRFQRRPDIRKGQFTIRANSGNNLHPCYTEKTVELSQDACNQAGITVEGLTGEDAVAFPAEQSEPLTLKVTATYDWTMTVSDESWVTVAPKKGSAGQVIDVALTPTPNTKFETHTSQLTITAGDPDYPENSAEPDHHADPIPAGRFA